MAGTPQEKFASINAATQVWRQGDFFLAKDLFFIHLANLADPITRESCVVAAMREKAGEPLEVEGVASSVIGYVVVTQTCDIVRDCEKRSYVEVSPLVEVSDSVLKETRLLRRPALAFVPGAADWKLMADLDRVVTVEKSILREYKPRQGCRNDYERRSFAEALARHKTRAPFPGDFNACMSPVRDHLKTIHKNTDTEGLLIQSIGEIRVTASPNWVAEKIDVFLWFILLQEAISPAGDISQYTNKWIALFGKSDKYTINAVVCRLEDMKASDYVGSDRLDLDSLSTR